MDYNAEKLVEERRGMAEYEVTGIGTGALMIRSTEIHSRLKA